MENIETLASSNNLIVFLIVLIALMSLFNLAGQSIETYRKIRKPSLEGDKRLEDRLAQYENYFANDRRRLDKHDQDIADLKMGMRNNCSGVKALLNHELHNGNADEMQKAADTIDQWLINR